MNLFFKVLAYFCLLSCILGLVACGNKGALFLPNKQAADQALLAKPEPTRARIEKKY